MRLLQQRNFGLRQARQESRNRQSQLSTVWSEFPDHDRARRYAQLLPRRNYCSLILVLALTQPIDVYYEWIDACDTVAKEEAGAVTTAVPSVRPSQPGASARAGLAPGEKYTDEDAGFIDDDDADAEAEYADE